jgi:hypothetical protein
MSPPTESDPSASNLKRGTSPPEASDKKGKRPAKKSKAQKREERARAEAGQAAIDNGQAPLPIDPKEAARFEALASGEKVTRSDFGYSVEDNLARAEFEVESYKYGGDAASQIEAMKSRIEAMKSQMEEPQVVCEVTANDLDDEDEDRDEDKDDDEDEDEGKDEDKASVTVKKTRKKSSPRKITADFDIFEEDSTESSAHPDIIFMSEFTTPRSNYLRYFDTATFGQLEKSNTNADSPDRKRRIETFDNDVRIIVRNLKSLAARYISDMGKQHQFCPMTRRYLVIIVNADEQWLCDQVLNGVPESTKVSIGKKGFNATDLLSMPCWDTAKFLQKGVYLNVVTTDEPESPEQLYVGSAAGQNGLCQRWYDYVEAGKGIRAVSGIHNEAIFNNYRHINIRALASYGDDPIAWLPHFSESVFMVLLGTVRDTGKRWSGKNSNMCCDELYKSVAECRHGLPEPIGPGLNSTWPLIQGFITRFDSERARCCNKNCNRPMVPKSDPRYKKHRFSSSDSARPGEEVICINCLVYQKRHGGEHRPLEIQERLIFREANPRDKCMWENCSMPLKYFHHKSPRPFGFDNGTILKHHVVTEGKFLWLCDQHTKLVRKLRKKYEETEARIQPTITVDDVESSSTS